MKPTYSTPLTDIYVVPIAERYASNHTAAVEGLIRKILGDGVEYGHTANGIPTLSPPPEGSFSVSHGAGMAVVAISRAANVGVDIEYWRPQLKRVAPRFVNTDEGGYEPDNLLRLWTAKEAVYKAALTPGLSLLDIHIAGSEARARSRRFCLSRFGEYPMTITLAESW